MAHTPQDEQRAYLAGVLDAIMAGAPIVEPRETVWERSIAAFAAFERLEPTRARMLAEQAILALTAESPPVERVAAYAARGLAAAMALEAGEWTDVAADLTPTGDPIVDALPFLDQLGHDDAGEFARYMLAEAALTCARVGFTTRLPVPRRERFLLTDGVPHPFSPLFAVLAARTAAFHGRVDDARAALDGVTGTHPFAELALNATRGLVAGNAADPDATRRFADTIAQMSPAAPSRVTVGCAMLAAYGLTALGDVRPAAALVLASNAGPDLDRLMTTDRAIGFELLVNAALIDDDPDAAEAWAARAEALRGSPIAAASVARIRSRMHLAHGDAAAAEREAERAIAVAESEGRGLEVAEAEILRARAAIAARTTGAADRHLHRLAAHAEGVGHHAAVRAAAQELRAAGRRLRPRPGSEWDGLTEREREVARLLLDGLSNAEIGAELFVSPHTVRGHVSRVLAAFGVASRFALVAHVPVETPGAVVATSELTPRQRQVVEAVASGASNADIASTLGISIKTVEKHLHEVMQRIGATGRVGVFRYAVAVGAVANKP